MYSAAHYTYMHYRYMSSTHGPQHLLTITLLLVSNTGTCCVRDTKYIPQDRYDGPFSNN